MQLLSVHLYNFRSHQDTHIQFTQGITLLTGDIGSGKSSILQAVEFGLFGLRKGEISGESLLRHGEENGWVEIRFLLGEKNILIRRELRRRQQAIRQETGMLRIDGESQELSATELKARILQLLGYPESLIHKSKGMLFRYTIYTPQEEMKSIITEAPKQRLDVLRGLYGIDEYKTILDNTTTLVRSLKEQAQYHKGKAEGMLDVQNSLKTLEEEEQRQQKEVLQAETALELYRQKEEEQKKRFQAQEELREEVHKQNQQRIRAQEKQRYLQEEYSRISKNKQEQTVKQPEPKADVQEQRDTVRRIEQRAEYLLAQKQEMLRNLHTPDEEALHLSTCPTCKQEVREEHKEMLKEVQKKRREEERQKRTELEETTTKLQEKIQLCKQKDALLKKKQEEYTAYLRAKALYEQAAIRREQDTRRLVELEKQLKEITIPESVPFDAEGYTRDKELYEQRRQQHAEAKIRLVRAQQTREYVQKQHKEKTEELKQKKEAQRAYSQVQENILLLQKKFAEAIQTIETEVFRRIHQECSAAFSQWLYKLLGEEGLFGSLNEEFSPILSQDGYDIEIASLSGGEKQSVALAYRLSLYQTMHAFIKAVPSEILLLDEPTEGFSDAQLDRLRDVLKELPVKQLILVSHEQKLYALGDTIYHIQKEHGRSVVHE